MKKFEVEITMPEVYESEIYRSNTDCYLARVLREKFPDSKIEVYDSGDCRIDGVRYETLNETPFYGGVIQDNLGKTLTIKFKRLW